MAKITIKQVPANEVLPVRHQVLRADKPLAEAIFENDAHPDTFHLAGILADKVIAVASFMVDTNSVFQKKRQYRLRGMAVLPAYQNKQLGKKLLDKGIQILQQEKTELLWCNARIKAAPFYEKNGFKHKGDVFDIPEIGPHYLMYKSI